MKIILLAAILTLAAGLTTMLEDASGHGVGSETFPPVDLNGRQVTLEVSSSQSDPETNDDQQISISLIDFDSKITLRDVKFLISSEHGGRSLFEREFDADNGFLVFNFVSEDTDEIILEEESNSNILGSLLGLENSMIHVRGPDLSSGGLYKFDVSVLAVDGYSNVLSEPLVFNAGISIAQTTSHTVNDEHFGSQTLDVITYYDKISDFQYNSELREISYTMPFEWTEISINQTSVVHVELSIPKSFGDLLVSGFTLNVNGVDLSEDVVNIDDFFTEHRTVHFVIYQKELFNILENGSNQNRGVGQATTLIPSWVRNNALWWSDDQIDDATFIQAVEYLIKNEIIQVPPTQQQDSGYEEIPSWVRNNAEWWGNGLIDDATFIQGLEFLIQKGIIRL